jgi:hypothetical protein
LIEFLNYTKIKIIIGMKLSISTEDKSTEKS